MILVYVLIVFGVVDKDWWCGVVIYQIYLCSFQDSNGDGIGDLFGIVQWLFYIVLFGVDVIWILLFFILLMKDFGYDVLDYCDVDLMFGILVDFDVVIEIVYVFGVWVMIDFVLLYIFDQYVWFGESC